jgi:hypothetical protein
LIGLIVSNYAHRVAEAIDRVVKVVREHVQACVRLWRSVVFCPQSVKIAVVKQEPLWFLCPHRVAERLVARIEYCCSVVRWGVIKLAVIAARLNEGSAEVNSEVVFGRLAINPMDQSNLIDLIDE